MKKKDLSKLIGMPVPEKSDQSAIFNAAIVSILCTYWKSIDMYQDDLAFRPENPAYVLSHTTLLKLNKFYFEIDFTNPNFGGLDSIILAVENSLDDVEGISSVVVQGSRMIITGSNKKEFSVSFFEVGEFHCDKTNTPTKRWLMHTTPH